MPEDPEAEGVADDSSAEDRAELVALINGDPLLFCEANPPQARFYDAVANPTPGTLTIVLLLKGNGVGGSFGLAAAWSAIMFGSANPRFQRAPYGAAWPFPTKSARLVSTIEALKDKGPIQRAMAEVFPVDEYRQRRDSGKSYYSEGLTSTGWEWDVFTYDQNPLQAASATKSLILFSEPPPQEMFVECCTRLRGQGLIILEMTQLDMADFVDEYVNAGALVLDGKKVGEVRVVRGDVEENCRDHYPPNPDDPAQPCGQRPHSSILADIALWPAEEREARRTGKSMNRSGRIYPTWGDANELLKLPPYHKSCWDRREVMISHSMDPHDRKPWAMAWFATFPNDDIIAIAEWPPFDFHTARESPLNDAEDYRTMILDTEVSIGRPLRRGGRIGDPRFIEAPQAGTDDSVRTMLARPCRECLDKYKGKDKKDRKEATRLCPHKLIYRPAPDSARINHAPLRAMIGDPAAKVRPKFYAMKEACPNVCYGFRHYSYYEQKNKLKGLSEKPQYVVKDFPDVCRYVTNARLHLWPEEVEALEMVEARTRGRGTTNT